MLLQKSNKKRAPKSIYSQISGAALLYFSNSVVSTFVILLLYSEFSAIFYSSEQLWLKPRRRQFTMVLTTYDDKKIGLLAGLSWYKLHALFTQKSYCFEAINIVCIFIERQEFFHKLTLCAIFTDTLQL